MITREIPLVPSLDAECTHDVSISPTDNLIITESEPSTLSCTAPCFNVFNPVQAFIKPNGHDIQLSFGSFVLSEPSTQVDDARAICTYSINISWPRNVSNQDQISGLNLVGCSFEYHTYNRPQLPVHCRTGYVRVVFDTGTLLLFMQPL